MAEPRTLEDIAIALNPTPRALITDEDVKTNEGEKEKGVRTLSSLTMPLGPLSLQKNGSVPTPESDTLEGAEKRTLSTIQSRLLSEGQYGGPPYELNPDDEELSFKAGINFLNAFYANTFDQYQATMAQLGGDHERSKWIRQEMAKRYESGISGSAGELASSIAPQLAVYGLKAAGKTSVGAVVGASWLLWTGVTEYADQLYKMEEEELETGKDFSTYREVSTALGSALLQVGIEALSMFTFVTKVTAVKPATLAKLGAHYLKGQKDEAIKLIMKVLPASIAEGAIIEGSEEVLQNFTSNLFEATYNPDIRTMEAMVSGTGKSFLFGAIAGGVLGPAARGISLSQKESIISLTQDMADQEAINRIREETKIAIPNMSEEHIDMWIMSAKVRGAKNDKSIAEVMAEDELKVVQSRVEELKHFMEEYDTDILFNMIRPEDSRLTKIEKDNLDEAKKAIQSGVNKHEVFKKYGWFYTEQDNAWKLRINPELMTIKQPFHNALSNNEEVYNLRLQDVIDYETLFRLYPDMKDADVSLRHLPERVFGTYDPYNKAITIDPWKVGNNPIKQKFPTMPNETFQKAMFTHEIQHLIQDREGFLHMPKYENFYGLADDSKIIADFLKKKDYDIDDYIAKVYPSSTLEKHIKTILFHHTLMGNGLALDTNEVNHFTQHFSRLLNKALRTTIGDGPYRDVLMVNRKGAINRALMWYEQLLASNNYQREQVDRIMSAIRNTIYNKDVVEQGRKRHTAQAQIASLFPKYYKGTADYFKRNFPERLDIYKKMFIEQEAVNAEAYFYLTKKQRDLVPVYAGKAAVMQISEDGEMLKRYSDEGDLQQELELGKDKTFFHSSSTGEYRGAVEFDSDGPTIIHAFKSANTETMFHELGHILRRDLTETELKKAEKLFKVKGGVWTRANEESFAEHYVEWHKTGTVKNKEYIPIFEKIQRALINLYEGVVNINPNIEVSKEMNDFFSSLYNNKYEPYSDPRAVEGRSNSIRDIARKMYYGVLDRVDIEAKAKRFGWKYIGSVAKRMASIMSHHQDQGLQLVRGMHKSLVQQGYSRKDAGKMLNDLVLIYEDLDIWEQKKETLDGNILTDAEIEALTPAYNMLDDYLKTSKQEYIESGEMKQGFVERMQATISEQLQEVEGKPTTPKRIKKAGDLRDVLKITNRMNFVPIPLALWLESKYSYNPRATKKILSIVVRRGRKSMKIADLIKAEGTYESLKEFAIKREDIKLGDIISSYSYRKGKDFANIALREAAIKDDAVRHHPLTKAKKRSKHIPEGFAHPASNLPFVRNYIVKNSLNEFLGDITKRVDSIGLPSKVLNVAKMTAFWNPVFLPMYDMVQAAMLGSFNPINPKSYTRLHRAMKMVLEQGEDYQSFKQSGLFSTPFPNPLKGHMDAMNAMFVGGKKAGVYGSEMELHLANFFGSTIPIYRGVGINPIKAVKSYYNMSWKTAWLLDNVVRVNSALYLTEKVGMSKYDAAQRAALFHGDYAGVPANTRKHLNRIFFTPTFKIAMGKLYINMLKGTAETIDPTVKTSTQAKRNMMSMMRTLAIVGGFDILLTSLGFERDEWGRRYVKETETEKGPKESVLTWSGPHNMFLKYLYRARDAMKPEVDNSIKRFTTSNKWEIHPLYRVALEVQANRQPNGDPITYAFDDPLIKLWKRMKYSLVNIVGVLKLGQGIEEPGARRALAKESSAWFSALTQPFTFTYLRDIKPVRATMSVKSLKTAFSRDVHKLLEKSAYIDPVKYEKMTNNFIERVEKILLNYDLIDYDLDDEPR